MAAGARLTPRTASTFRPTERRWTTSRKAAALDEEGAESPTSSYRTGEEHPLFGHEGETRGGEVKWFNDRKGFGFITLDDGNELFVHYSGIVSEGYKTLKQGQRVRLVLEDTDKGPQASRVTVDEEEAEPAA